MLRITCERRKKIQREISQSGTSSTAHGPIAPGIEEPISVHNLGVTYLEKPEMDALLAAPDLKTAQGRRDHLIRLFLYNTGARADEAAQLLIADLDLAQVPSRDFSSVKIRGKGNKERRCPVWPQTVKELIPAIGGRPSGEHVFLNRYGRPITRFGDHGFAGPGRSTDQHALGRGEPG